MDNYTKFCESKGCEYFIEWEFDTEYGPYPCNSCTKIGQSYEVEEYPEDCLFLDEIKLYGTQDKSKLPHAGQADPLPHALDRRGTNELDEV